MDEPHLPMERSKFIGRRRDVQQLRDLVARNGLVTVTGPPGVGKTRLAIHLARLESPHFADGATFLDLAGVTVDELVAGEIAEQLGFNLDASGEPARALAAALEGREVLLILDNCEQVAEGAARVCAGILSRCPGVRIVATSREPLRVEGEVLWPLAPLELPARGASLHELRRTGSAALFAERASAREPTFSLSEATRADIAAICEAVDGLPLAIELAAALVGSLTLSDIAAGLQRELGLLVRGGRLIERHRTLRSAIDWSYSLLSEPERAVLLRLSVFPGDFDLAAASAVCGEGLGSDASVVSHVVALAEKSLVQATPGEGGMRYRLLVPIRQYCLEGLAGSPHLSELRSPAPLPTLREREGGGGLESVQMRHLAYYLAEAEAAEPSLMSGHREASLTALGLELHNIRAALEFGLGSADDVANDGAARLAAALLWFWCVAARPAEGMIWLEKAEKLREHLPIETQAKVLDSGGELAWLLGEEALGRAWLEESADIWRSLGEPRRVAYCLQALSFLVEPELGREQAEESIAIFRDVDDAWGGALAVHTLGDD